MVGDTATESVQAFFMTGLLITVLTLLLIIFLRRGHKKNVDSKLPPIYSGWLPWIGCSVEFGKAPVHFVEQKRKEVSFIIESDVFIGML